MFVAMAEALKAVMNVIEQEIRTTRIVIGSPRLPTTHPSLRYIIRPIMVSVLGVNTPRKVPNLGDSSFVVETGKLTPLNNLRIVMAAVAKN